MKTANLHAIIFQLCAPTSGWIGIGFSPAGTMVKSDLIIMGVKGDSYVVVSYLHKHDYFFLAVSVKRIISVLTLPNYGNSFVSDNDLF